MKLVRRPAVALSTMLALVVIQAIADPTGLLALVGWSGAGLSFAAGLWSFAPYLVFVPVLLVVVWWVAVRAAERFWTLTAGVLLAVLLAQAVTALVMTWDLAAAGYAAGFVVAKAVPAALIVAGVTRCLGALRRPRRERLRTQPARSGRPQCFSLHSPRCSRASGGVAQRTPPAFRRHGRTGASCR